MLIDEFLIDKNEGLCKGYLDVHFDEFINQRSSLEPYFLSKINALYIDKDQQPHSNPRNMRSYEIYFKRPQSLNFDFRKVCYEIVKNNSFIYEIRYLPILNKFIDMGIEGFCMEDQFHETTKLLLINPVKYITGINYKDYY